MDDNETRDRLLEIIKDFEAAMLVTRTANGECHARPLALAEIRPDGGVVFATSLRSPKVAEISHNPRVTVTFQSPSRYATLHGVARVFKDRSRVEKLWSKAWQVWFPGGKDDPDLCLVHVSAHSGEYWDHAGAQGLKYVFAAAKAYLQRE